MPPTVPINHYLTPRNQQNRGAGPRLLCHANVFKACACFKHSNFLKVNDLNFAPRSQAQPRPPERCPGRSRYSPRGRTSRLRQKSNYELFNRNNFNIRSWSWNYRGCWHQTCPPVDTHKEIKILFIPITRHGCPVLLFLVTTSLCQDWVICAPAAFLRCGSRFSGSLSGIEP